MTKKISFDDTYRFDNDGFSGNVYIDSDSEKGFNALLVQVYGEHPKKRILDGNTRVHLVIEGEGEFTIDNTVHKVTKNDMFVISAGSEYEYSGGMTLFEFNISPDNSFRDLKL